MPHKRTPAEQRLDNAEEKICEVLSDIQDTVFEGTNFVPGDNGPLTDEYFECKNEIMLVLGKWMNRWEKRRA